MSVWRPGRRCAILAPVNPDARETPEGAGGAAGEPPAPDPADLFDLATGLLALGLEAAVSLAREQAGTDRPDESSTATTAGPGDLLDLGAALGRAGLNVASTTAARAGRLVSGAASFVRPAAEAAVSLTPLRGPAGKARESAEAWQERARAEGEERRRAARDLVERLIGGISAAVVDQVDINAIVARVDVNRIVDGVDLNAAAARIDLNAIASRIDLNAIIERLDLPNLVRSVMDEVDVAEIIRESTGSMTTEAMDGIRYQGMNADRLVSRFVDRIMFRRGGRDLQLTGRSPNGEDADHRPSP